MLIVKHFVLPWTTLTLEAEALVDLSVVVSEEYSWAINSRWNWRRSCSEAELHLSTLLPIDESRSGGAMLSAEEGFAGTMPCSLTSMWDEAFLAMCNGAISFF